MATLCDFHHQQTELSVCWESKQKTLKMFRFISLESPMIDTSLKIFIHEVEILLHDFVFLSMLGKFYTRSVFHEAGKMVPWLKTLVALVEDPGWVPRTHNERLTIISSSRGSKATFRTMRTPAPVGHLFIHIKIKIVRKPFKQESRTWELRGFYFLSLLLCSISRALTRWLGGQGISSAGRKGGTVWQSSHWQSIPTHSYEDALPHYTVTMIMCP